MYMAMLYCTVCLSYSYGYVLFFGTAEFILCCVRIRIRVGVSKTELSYCAQIPIQMTLHGLEPRSQQIIQTENISNGFNGFLTTLLPFYLKCEVEFERSSSIPFLYRFRPNNFKIGRKQRCEMAIYKFLYYDMI